MKMALYENIKPFKFYIINNKMLILIITGARSLKLLYINIPTLSMTDENITIK